MQQHDLQPKLIIGLSSEHAYKDITYPHSHLRAQLLYASKGTIQVMTHQQIWIVPPMCALWIPARIEHSLISLSHVRLTTALIEEKAAAGMGSHCFLIRVTRLLHELLIRLNELDQLHTTHNISSSELYSSLQTLIFNEIHRALSFPIQIPWPKDKRLIKICEKLMQSPDQPKDLTFWADQIGTSSRTLMRMFQKETGLSYRAWIQQMHIALAFSKLTDGESISTIAESLGYSSSSAFTTMFKRHVGQTPQQFRQAVERPLS